MHIPRLTLALAAGLALTLGACASKPKPGPMTAAVDTGPSAPSNPDLPQPPSPVAEAAAASLQAQFAQAAGDRVFFALDSHTLDDGARDTLRQQAAWLARRGDIDVTIAGNADERGTREYNLALGARRADAARQFLISQGVPATRLKTISYGKEQPFDPGSGEDAWAKNRNGQTVVVDISGRR